MNLFSFSLSFPGKGVKMLKKTIVLLMALGLLIALTSVAFAAADGVKNSPHNLSSVTGTNQTVTSNEGQICVFCHTPHNAKVAVPLWNRNNPDGSVGVGNTFQMYGNSSTLDGSVGTSLSSSVSLMCLSCHDGATALNSYGEGTTVVGDVAGVVTSGVLVSDANLGTDLTNDHPINITYVPGSDPGQDSELASIGAIEAAGIDLFTVGAATDTVQCGSCHDVHNYGTEGTTRPFLRISNQASGLCVTCHLK